VHDSKLTRTCPNPELAYQPDAKEPCTNAGVLVAPKQGLAVRPWSRVFRQT